jgi:hypothetical protein
MKNREYNTDQSESKDEVEKIFTDEDAQDILGSANLEEGYDLADRIAADRKDQIAELQDKDISGIDLWIVSKGFTSPYPDRTNVFAGTTHQEVLRAILDFLDSDQLPGTILSIDEDLLNWVRLIATHLNLELGHIITANDTPSSWVQWTREVKNIEALDIGDLMSPQHLVDPDVVLEALAENELRTGVDDNEGD